MPKTEIETAELTETVDVKKLVIKVAAMTLLPIAGAVAANLIAKKIDEKKA